MKALLLVAGLLFVQSNSGDEQPRALPFYCQDRNTVTISKSLFHDTENDHWVTVLDHKSKMFMIGFISHIHGKFCSVATAQPR